MRNVLTPLLILLLAFGLTACDENKTAQDTPSPAAKQHQQDPNISLLNGKLNFTLPTGWQDQSQNLTPPTHSKFIYTDPSGEQSLIVLLDTPTLSTAKEHLQQLAERRLSRDEKTRILLESSITLGNYAFERLDLLSQVGSGAVQTMVLMGLVDGELLTLQMTIDAPDTGKAQEQLNTFIQTIKLK